MSQPVALITGCSSGIGRALAEVFQQAGYQVWATARKAEDLAALSAAGFRAVELDVNDGLALGQLAERLKTEIGGLDVLINNAGAEHPTAIDDPAPDAMARWAALLDNNVTSMARLTAALLPLLAPGACVINQSSIWGRIGVPGFSAYVASKHAVIGLTRSLALELGPRGVRVNAVCPGWVRTGAAMRSLVAMARTQGRTEAEVERDILAQQAVPVMLTPEALAPTFLFLASDDAAPITGQAIVVSHGEVMA